MDSRVHRRVQRYGWDAAVTAYFADWVPLIERLTAECVRRAGLRPGESALDVATGPGVAALLAAESVGPSGRVLGIDISDNMVALAAERARARALAQLSFERHDMEATGAPDATFDAVLCAFGLMFAAERQAAIDELHRVTRPGGRLSVVVWGQRASCRWAELFSIVDRHVDSDVCPMFFAFGVPGALARGLERAGFTDLQEERRAITLAFASADDACRAMLEGGAVALAWKRFSPAVRQEVRRAFLESIAEFRDGAGYRVPSEVVFAVARRSGSEATERAVPSLVTP
jgi:ubiquinone/menaquinone biosynthesis C-methylase UbiE